MNDIIKKMWIVQIELSATHESVHVETLFAPVLSCHMGPRRVFSDVLQNLLTALGSGDTVS